MILLISKNLLIRMLLMTLTAVSVSTALPSRSQPGILARKVSDGPRAVRASHGLRGGRGREGVAGVGRAAAVLPGKARPAGPRAAHNPLPSFFRGGQGRQCERRGAGRRWSGPADMRKRRARTRRCWCSSRSRARRRGCTCCWPSTRRRGALRDNDWRLKMSSFKKLNLKNYYFHANFYFIFK